MPIQIRQNLWGARAFLAGVILALIVGVFFGSKINPTISAILAILGIVVGYFVSEEDSHTFLLASVSLVIVSYAGISGIVLDAAIRGIQIGKIVSSVLGTLLVLFVPATITVAIKTVYSISNVK